MNHFSKLFTFEDFQVLIYMSVSEENVPMLVQMVMVRGLLLEARTFFDDYEKLVSGFDDYSELTALDFYDKIVEELNNIDHD